MQKTIKLAVAAGVLSLTAVGALPAGWPTFTFWQYSDTGTFPGDQDVFNGSRSQLIRLATAAPINH